MTHPLAFFPAALRRWGPVLVVLLWLAACGGGGGGTAALPDGTVQPGPTQVGSLYAGQGASPGFLAMARSTGGGHEFVAVNHAVDASNTLSVTLYSGTLVAGVNGNASSADLKTMRPNGNVRSATGSFTQVSATQMSASFDAASINDRAVHQAASAQPLDDVAGSWTGRWADGLQVNTSVTLSGLAAGASMSLSQSVFFCSNIAISLGAFDAASGLYTVQLTYPAQQTGCARQGTQLQGLASVRQVGGQRRLQFVAVDASGSGVSFQADR